MVAGRGRRLRLGSLRDPAKRSRHPYSDNVGPPPPLNGPNPAKSARIRRYQSILDDGASGLPEPFLRLFRFLCAIPPEREVGRSNRPGRTGEVPANARQKDLESRWHAQRLPARSNFGSSAGLLRSRQQGSPVKPPTVSNRTSSRRLNESSQCSIPTTGRAWLPGQTLAKRVRDRLPTRRLALRAGSLRPAQLSADHPEEVWTIRRFTE